MLIWSNRLIALKYVQSKIPIPATVHSEHFYQNCIVATAVNSFFV